MPKYRVPYVCVRVRVCVCHIINYKNNNKFNTETSRKGTELNKNKFCYNTN